MKSRRIFALLSFDDPTDPDDDEVPSLPWPPFPIPPIPTGLPEFL